VLITPVATVGLFQEIMKKSHLSGLIPACFALLSCLSWSADSASAETVLKFNLDGFGFGGDVASTSSAFVTVDDGNPAVTGDQTTNVAFTGFLDPLFMDITSGASFSLSGVMASGNAGQQGGILLQETMAGMFTLYDDSNSVLLQGNIDQGFIFGGAISTGSFFTTTPVLYTGGSLLPLMEPDSGNLSLSLTDVRTNGTTGMVVLGGVLQDFTADATGQLEASAVPEPSVMGMAALASVLVIRRRRKRRKVMS
jgi:hypothetical protein